MLPFIMNISFDHLTHICGCICLLTHLSKSLLIHLNTHTDTQIGIYFNQGILIIVNQEHSFLWNVVSIWRIPQTISGETTQDQNFKGFILGSNFKMFSGTILILCFLQKLRPFKRKEKFKHHFSRTSLCLKHYSRFINTRSYHIHQKQHLSRAQRYLLLQLMGIKTSVP